MKRVLFDSEIFALQKFGGASKYFSEVIREFIDNRQLGIEPRLTFKRSNNYYLRSINSLLQSQLGDARPVYVTPTSPWKTLLTLGPVRQASLNLSCGVNFSKRSDSIFHATYYRPTFMERIGSNSMAITIHDFIPEHLGWSNVRNPHIGKKRLLAQADLIFCVSHSTAEDLADFYDISDNRVRVVHHGVRNLASLEEKKGTQKRNVLPKLLYVGHRSGYKNFEVFAKAISVLSERAVDFSLVTVGPEFSAEEIASYGLNLHLGRWTHTSEADDEQLMRLYREATVFVMTSKMEGFGMPILEALSQGTKVVASDIPVFREIGENLVSYFVPESEESLVEVLTTLMHERDSEMQIHDRINFAREKSWSRTAKIMADAYKGLES